MEAGRHPDTAGVLSVSTDTPLRLPRKFKSVLGKHADRFNNNEQHDCQELLACLLDKLHEDTNRVEQKPYIEEADDDDTASDTDLAEQAWHNYKCAPRQCHPHAQLLAPMCSCMQSALY